MFKKLGVLFTVVLLVAVTVIPANAAANDALLRTIEAFDPNYATVCVKTAGDPECPPVDADSYDFVLQSGSLKPYSFEGYREDFGITQSIYFDLLLTSGTYTNVGGSGVVYLSGTGSGTPPSCNVSDQSSTRFRFLCASPGQNNLNGFAVLLYFSSNATGTITVKVFDGTTTKSVVASLDT